MKIYLKTAKKKFKNTANFSHLDCQKVENCNPNLVLFAFIFCFHFICNYNPLLPNFYYLITLYIALLLHYRSLVQHYNVLLLHYDNSLFWIDMLFARVFF